MYRIVFVVCYCAVHSCVLWCCLVCVWLLVIVWFCFVVGLGCLVFACFSVSVCSGLCCVLMLRAVCCLVVLVVLLASGDWLVVLCWCLECVCCGACFGLCCFGVRVCVWL